MGILPVLKPSQVVKKLEELGFLEIRQKGSHKQYKHSDGRFTTVHFILAGIFLRNCCEKLQRTSELMLLYLSKSV
jgi:hypothetical protein